MNDHVIKRHDTIHVHWVGQCKADPEFGGSDFHRNLRIAKTAVDRLGGRGLRKALEETGMGSHPEIVRAFWKMGHVLSQAKQQSPASEPKDWGKIFYPNFPNP